MESELGLKGEEGDSPPTEGKTGQKQCLLKEKHRFKTKTTYFNESGRCRDLNTLLNVVLCLLCGISVSFSGYFSYREIRLESRVSALEFELAQKLGRAADPGMAPSSNGLVIERLRREVEQRYQRRLSRELLSGGSIRQDSLNPHERRPRDTGDCICRPAAIASMDSVGSNRRHRGNHEEPEFSNQIIMDAMEKFVNTVQEMDETILFPCRLMDLKVGDATGNTSMSDNKPEVLGLLKHADLYSLYSMVNSVRNELLWGHRNQPSEEPAGPLFVPGVVVEVTSLPPSHSTPNCINFSSLPNTKTHSRNSSASNIKLEKHSQNHQRRPSTGSLISTHSMTSVSLSDTDSETGNENDSGIEDGSDMNPTLQIALSFKRHLTGLYKSLEQMTQAASYLTQRYQHDVGGNV